MAHENTPILDVRGTLATITLNRPAYRNRLHNEDLRMLLDHCAAVERDRSIRVLVITSNTSAAANGESKPVFCAGFHVGDFDAGETAVPFEQVPDAIAGLRPVTICAMPGSVYGGATDLGLACDFRIGVKGMELKMPAAAIGLHYYPSGLARYISRLGLGFSKRAFLTAQTVSDVQLLQMGYLDELVEREELDNTVDAWVRQIQALAPLAVEGMKRSLNILAETGSSSDNIALVRKLEGVCAHSRDFAEGRLAFGEKRAPVFSGE